MSEPAREGEPERDEAANNVARVRDFVVQVEQEGHLDLINEFVAADFQDLTAEPGQPGDRGGVRRVMAALHEAFGDLEVEIVHCIGSADVVATYKVFRGRHVGDWWGSSGAGEPVELRVVDFMRLRDGRQVQHWAIVDQLRAVLD